MRLLPVVIAIIVGSILLLMAMLNPGKESLGFAFLGALILSCTFALELVHRLASAQVQRQSSNSLALAGAMLGGLSGSAWGVFDQWGESILAVLNPDLPSQDFGSAVGAIAGAIVGSLIGAIMIGGCVNGLGLARPRKSAD